MSRSCICENIFNDMVINDGDHDEEIDKKAPGDATHHSNVIASLVIRMKHMSDLHDKFKRVTNC